MGIIKEALKIAVNIEIMELMLIGCGQFGSVRPL